MSDAQTWFDHNSFHHRDFADLEELCALRDAQGLKISVVIPTLNEERTIADVVRIVRTVLQERHPLVHELLVIDSGSTDQTRQRATEAGAKVHLASEILPELGDHPGKGENLWKALAVIEGDLVCFIDADIQNMHPRFVCGLIGPLLKHPEISYIKGFYERPMSSGTRILPNEGGRITELLVRPLFSIFYPELARFCQPLAGEYAARRELLEQLAFPNGYGVESAHLIDCLNLIGIDALAQCDLDERIHRNRSLQDLSITSHEILQAILPRLERDGHCAQLGALAENLFRVESTSGGYEITEKQVKVVERPSMKSILSARPIVD